MRYAQVLPPGWISGFKTHWRSTTIRARAGHALVGQSADYVMRTPPVQRSIEVAQSGLGFDRPTKGQSLARGGGRILISTSLDGVLEVYRDVGARRSRRMAAVSVARDVLARPPDRHAAPLPSSPIAVGRFCPEPSRIRPRPRALIGVSGSSPPSWWRKPAPRHPACAPRLAPRQRLRRRGTPYQSVHGDEARAPVHRVLRTTSATIPGTGLPQVLTVSHRLRRIEPGHPGRAERVTPRHLRVQPRPAWSGCVAVAPVPIDQVGAACRANSPSRAGGACMPFKTPRTTRTPRPMTAS